MRLGKVRHESKYLDVRHFHSEKNWSIEWMCRQLEISRAAYYKWLHREAPEAGHENMKLAELTKEYDERFGHILGYRRMTSWINHFNHTAYSRNRVHRIMKKLGIHSAIRKKRKKYIGSKPDETAENILKRDFYASAPNQKWATGVTEFKVPGEKKKLYLSAILDLYDRYPVAYVISPKNDNRLVHHCINNRVKLYRQWYTLISPFKGFCRNIILFNETQYTFFQLLYRLIAFSFQQPAVYNSEPYLNLVHP